MTHNSAMKGPKERPSSFADRVVLHVIAFTAFVLFPAFVTAVAPVSWVTFTREGEVVSATTQQCVFFVIPYLTRTVSPVTGVETSFSPGVLVPNSDEHAGSDRMASHRTEDQADLRINGPDQEASVTVSPVDIERIHKSVAAFLADPQTKSLKFGAVANWKASVFAGAPLSLLTGFYVVFIAIKLGRASIGLVR
jgi:hypothetical protein